MDREILKIGIENVLGIFSNLCTLSVSALSVWDNFSAEINQFCSSEELFGCNVSEYLCIHACT